jgi:hypothetical protein
MNTAVVEFPYTGKAATNYSVSHVLGCQGRVGKKGETLVVLPCHRDGGINTPRHWHILTVAANGTKGSSYIGNIESYS